jgi:hypothetical protein
MNETSIIIPDWIIAVATVVLAIYAVSNFRLAKSIQEKNEQHEQETKDLLQALVLAELCRPHGGENTNKGIQRFKNLYSGKTEIFCESSPGARCDLN